jgi:hypothetical protein
MPAHRRSRPVGWRRERTSFGRRVWVVAIDLPLERLGRKLPGLTLSARLSDLVSVLPRREPVRCPEC